MKKILVSKIMVPISQYVTVKKDATLGEAVVALRTSHGESDTKYLHRAVLVLDEKNEVVGKVSFISVFKALEPKYDQMLSDNSATHLGFTRKYQKDMIEQFKLWEDPMERVCHKAAMQKVENFMTKPTEGEYIDKNATLDEAIHEFVMHHHQSLLVTDGKKIVGILKLPDVFEVVADAISVCEIPR